MIFYLCLKRTEEHDENNKKPMGIKPAWLESVRFSLTFKNVLLTEDVLIVSELTNLKGFEKVNQKLLRFGMIVPKQVLLGENIDWNEISFMPNFC